MERNDFLEKIKKNWKKILIIGGISYVALTLISTAVGAAFITKRGKQIENCEDEIGREFQARKSEFQESFNKNWNNGIDKLVKGFDESQKKREQQALKLGESLLEDAKRRLKGNIWKIAPALKVELEKEIAQLEKDTRIEQAAFKRKWFSQCDSETTEQYERRKAEGSID